MRRVLFAIIVLSTLIMPVRAMDFTAPSAPDEAEKYMPSESASFSKDLLHIIKSALEAYRPDIAQAASVCVNLIAVTLLGSIAGAFSDSAKKTAQLVMTIIIGLLLFKAGNSLIELGKQTVFDISEYGKLLLPVLTGALAAQGATTTSAAIYTGTAFFSSALSSVIANVFVPLLYIFLCISIAGSALGNTALQQIKSFLKWILTWALKIILYVFTGYLSVTGVISGTVDASALKAAKLTITGVVPVVGSILSDASETIIVSAGVMKNSAGVYGVLVLAALLIGPFLKIGVQYLFLKITAAVCAVIAPKDSVQAINDFSAGMGLILAMTGSACLLLMIGIVCIMKGVS